MSRLLALAACCALLGVPSALASTAAGDSGGGATRTQSSRGSKSWAQAEIKVVDFSGLDATQKHSALEAANAARCTCGCGMTLAQCVATDSTCPIREDNVAHIRRLVDQASRTKS